MAERKALARSGGAAPRGRSARRSPAPGPPRCARSRAACSPACSRRSALRWTSSQRSPLSAPRGARPSASSSGPSISVSGVRNSWLTLEKKAVLARSSSASASAAPLLRLEGAGGRRARPAQLGDQLEEVAVARRRRRGLRPSDQEPAPARDALRRWASPTPGAAASSPALARAGPGAHGSFAPARRQAGEHRRERLDLRAAPAPHRRPVASGPSVARRLVERPNGTSAALSRSVSIDIASASASAAAPPLAIVRQPAQRAEPALAEHLRGRLARPRRTRRRPRRLVADRAVGEGEVALLGVAVALQQEQLVVRPGGRPRASTASSIGPMTSQISAQHSRPAAPSARGCLPPSIGR